MGNRFGGKNGSITDKTECATDAIRLSKTE